MNFYWIELTSQQLTRIIWIRIFFDAEEFNSMQKKSNSDFKHCSTFAYVHKKLNIYLKN